MRTKNLIGLAIAMLFVAGCSGGEPTVGSSEGDNGERSSQAIFDEACEGRTDILDTTTIGLDIRTIPSYEEFLASLSRGALKRAQNVGGPGQIVPLRPEQEQNLLASLKASVERGDRDTDFSDPRSTEQNSYDLIWYGEIDTKRSVNNQAGENEGFCVAG